MNPEDLILHSDRTSVPSRKLIHVTPESAGWEYTGLVVQRLQAGESWSFTLMEEEAGIVVLSGACTIEACGTTWDLPGRTSIFAGQPWALYVPVWSQGVITAQSLTEFAYCTSRATTGGPPRLITPDDVEVEIRGAGNACRQINHIIKPDFPAHRLLIVEVFTPSGNWSSYPPHKHDVSDLPREADLEEIYYYRIDPDDGFGLQRLHTTDGKIDQAYVIHDGDVLLVPEGYHTFAVAHGYTGYY